MDAAETKPTESTDPQEGLEVDLTSNEHANGVEENGREGEDAEAAGITP